MGSQDQHRVVGQVEQPKRWDDLNPTQRLHLIGTSNIPGYSPASGNYARPADSESVHGTQQGDTSNATDEQGWQV
jgi:hypothetical protein